MVCQSGGIRTAIRPRGTVAEGSCHQIVTKQAWNAGFKRVLTRSHLINSQVQSVNIINVTAYPPPLTQNCQMNSQVGAMVEGFRLTQ